MSSEISTVRKQIKFQFQPDRFPDGHAVEKAEGDKKRRYLTGVASGSKIDGHGEYLTEKAVKSLHEQATDGDILLYADKHGVEYTKDIGILTKSEMTPDGDWAIEFRLYDDMDGVGQATLETADRVWKQALGLPPYTRPRQKGFSIEGFIPDDGILKMESDGRRVIDAVELDGCVLVPRPAYKTSIAMAVQKALGEGVYKPVIQSTVKKGYTEAQYYRTIRDLNDALQENIEAKMKAGANREELAALFDEYKNVMIDTLQEYKEVFDFESNSIVEDESTKIELYKSIQGRDKVSIYKQIIANLTMLEKKITAEVL